MNFSITYQGQGATNFSLPLMLKFSRFMRLKVFLLSTCLFFSNFLDAQNLMTPEQLLQLGRVSGVMVTPDGNQVIYRVSKYDISANKTTSTLFSIPITGGTARTIPGIPGDASLIQALPAGNWGFGYQKQWWETSPGSSKAIQLTHLEKGMHHIRLSPDGKYILFSHSTQEVKVKGSDIYPQFPKADVYIYNHLNYRHWDKWFTGKVSHVYYATYDTGQVGMPVDIMKGEPYDCPQKPFGGAEDFIWSPDGKFIVYVCKKKFGKAYALSTNTDIYFYSLETGKTTDFTSGMMGYDMAPAFSPDGNMLAWTSMKTEGYESDKNDIILCNLKTKKKYNLTRGWDGTVNDFTWSKDGKSLFFTAATNGTIQLFSITLGEDMKGNHIHQLTHGVFDVNTVVGQSGNTLVLDRTDMNHAAELFTLSMADDSMTQLTSVNSQVYSHLSLSRVEKRWIRTTDHKKELVWVIYPPDFDSTRKYPTLLYCEGGPQSPLTQYYSFRWNFQLIAANGYIIVAPNRRGMPGFGVKWNEEISRDFGGQAMKDYLSAIDSMAKLPFVDKSRLGCIGASYGGYSVYLLEGMNNGRFRTFIAHDGMFDTQSWYGTTDEMWFANHDLGLPYGKDQYLKSYTQFNPLTYVDKWTAPILIVQGGIDYRVPVEQGLEAFKATQMLGIKSRLLYFPEEDHRVLQGQDALVWQHEFFRWLRETLNRQSFQPVK